MGSKWKIELQAGLSQAELVAREALQANPQDIRATMLLGVIAGRKGKYDECEALLRRAIAMEPTSFHAQVWLAIALRNQNRAEDALPFAQQATNQNPEDANASYQLGLCWLELGKPEEAECALRNAVMLDPRAAKLFEAHGRSLKALGRLEDAIRSFQHASMLDPASEEVLHQLGAALMEHGDKAGAAECVGRILKLDPHSVMGKLLLARSLFADQKGEEAIAAITEVVEEAPDWALGVLTAGRIFQGAGKFAEARVFFERAIESSAELGQAYLGIVQCHRVTPNEHDFVERMASLANNPTLPQEELRCFHFALGKSYDDLGEYGQAMAHFDEANKIEHTLRFGEAIFDRAAYKNITDQTINVFSRPFLARHRDAGTEDETPIFVVGMMRSGTTLTDQILSCHPQIGSAGEQQFWHANRNYVLDLSDGSLNDSKLRELAVRYLDIIEKHGPGGRRVVDKLPANYSVLGLIYLAFPRSRIIHISRHPVDTCISSYTTPNGARIEWAHRKENIVFVYREYLRYMEHWRKVLPAGQMLDIRYEDLVRDPEPVTRRLVEFCGLE